MYTLYVYYYVALLVFPQEGGKNASARRIVFVQVDVLHNSPTPLTVLKINKKKVSE